MKRLREVLRTHRLVLPWGVATALGNTHLLSHSFCSRNPRSSAGFPPRSHRVEMKVFAGRHPGSLFPPGCGLGRSQHVGCLHHKAHRPLPPLAKPANTGHICSLLLYLFCFLFLHLTHISAAPPLSTLNRQCNYSGLTW